MSAVIDSLSNSSFEDAIPEAPPISLSFSTLPSLSSSSNGTNSDVSYKHHDDFQIMFKEARNKLKPVNRNIEPEFKKKSEKEHIKGIEPVAVLENGHHVAIFACGCYWGVQHYFKQKYFKKAGIINSEVGFTGGDKSEPLYEEVLSCETHHLEALRVEYDPKVTTFKDLTKHFFNIHDATQEDGQGHDIGEQYKSVIFCLDETQMKVAEEIKNIAQLLVKAPIVTKILPAGIFWLAEDYHQNYISQKAGDNEAIAEQLCTHRLKELDWNSITMSNHEPLPEMSSGTPKATR